ncbi:MAG TPA: AzlD domain-containing protein [Aggregatilineales bacterium]|nr:AzlD domain-containing protein [Aggregatilineales bacterium]
MNDVILIAGMALVTFSVRYPVLALVGKMSLPTPLRRALSFVPAAVLTAIVVPALLYPASSDHVDISLGNSQLFAGIVAIVVAWRSRNLLLTIVLGMLALWGYRWLFHL